MFILRQSGINVEKAFDDLDNLDVNTSKNEDFESFI